MWSNSVGVGTHFFNYPDINVSLVGKVGLASTGNTSFEASIQPIFRGQVTPVDLMLTELDMVYQKSLTLKDFLLLHLGWFWCTIKTNYKKWCYWWSYCWQPRIWICVFRPDYWWRWSWCCSDPVTKTVGSGSTETTVIDYIKVISGGQNYTQDETTVTVSPSGFGAQFYQSYKNGELT